MSAQWLAIGVAPQQKLAALQRVLLPESEETWWSSAACTEVDPELWFPDPGYSMSAAIRICAQCEVRIPCLEFALTHHEKDGVWGGVTPRARRRMGRRTPPPAAAA